MLDLEEMSTMSGKEDPCYTQGTTSRTIRTGGYIEEVTFVRDRCDVVFEQRRNLCGNRIGKWNGMTCAFPKWL